MEPIPPELLPPELRDPGPDNLPRFPEEHKESFTGLAYLGALTKVHHWGGHEIRIRTLTQDENLCGALLSREWAGTVGETTAHQTAMVALCVTHVDGKVLPVAPLGEGEQDGFIPAAYAWALERFNWVKTHWYSWTIDEIFRNFLELENEARQILEAMEKVPAPLGPTRGSSTRPGSSNDAGS